MDTEGKGPKLDMQDILAGVIGENLRVIRQKTTLSHLQLAALSNVRRADILEFERGASRPTPYQLYDLAAALCVPIEAFFDGSRLYEGQQQGEFVGPFH